MKRLTQLTKEAPMSGAPTAGSALNAPQRSQRKAARGRKEKAPKVMERPADAFHPTSAPPPDMPPEPGVAAAWAEIAAIPGVTPLARELARRAMSGGV